VGVGLGPGENGNCHAVDLLAGMPVACQIVARQPGSLIVP
jgi:hypothetical protein